MVVFLVALPLCLGIALASNAPLISGLIAGVVGGIVVGLLGGSQVSVSGPAAGLTPIVAAALVTLAPVGGFQAFLAAVVAAGGLQMLMSTARAGRIIDYIPNCVIRGMLSAIGVVIILKQLPHGLGWDEDPEGDMEFINPANGLNTFEEILAAVQNPHWLALVITGLSLALLWLWDQPALKRRTLTRVLPGPMVVVVLGIAVFQLVTYLSPYSAFLHADKHFVQLPVDAMAFATLVQMPDFNALRHGSTWGVAITIALVASVESLLSLEAADKLDPRRRISHKSRELMAQGVGNVTSGLLGGLPVTAVIVRSSANVYAGGITRLSAISHGVLLGGAVLAIPGLLNLIPLASLAAILIRVGYKLASIKVFQEMYAQGLRQFVPFAVTVLAIIVTDLLIGVLIGIGVGFVMVLQGQTKRAFTLVNLGQNYLLRVNRDLSFLNKNELKEHLSGIPAGASLIVDGVKAMRIDLDVYQELADYVQAADFNNITVTLKNLENQAPPQVRTALQPYFKTA